MKNRRHGFPVVAAGAVVVLLSLVTACGVPAVGDLAPDQTAGPVTTQSPEVTPNQGAEVVQASEVVADPVAIELLSEAPNSLWAAELEPSFVRLEPLMRALEEAVVDENGNLQPNGWTIYSYDRQGFEEEATVLISRLASRHPQEFGGGTKDPVDPVIWLTRVGPAPALLADAAAATDFEVKWLEASTTWAERQKIAKRLTELGYWADGGLFYEYATMGFMKEEFAKDSTEITEAIQDAVGVPLWQSVELANALVELFSDESLIVGVAVGSLLVSRYEITDYRDGVDF